MFIYNHKGMTILSDMLCVEREVVNTFGEFISAEDYYSSALKVDSIDELVECDIEFGNIGEAVTRHVLYARLLQQKLCPMLGQTIN